MCSHSHALLTWQVDDTYVLSVELGSVPDDEEQEVSVARYHTGHVSDACRHTHVDAMYQCQYFDECFLNVSTFASVHASSTQPGANEDARASPLLRRLSRLAQLVLMDRFLQVRVHPHAVAVAESIPQPRIIRVSLTVGLYVCTRGVQGEEDLLAHTSTLLRHRIYREQVGCCYSYYYFFFPVNSYSPCGPHPLFVDALRWPSRSRRW